jgi:hypothetical protein
LEKERKKKSTYLVNSSISRYIKLENFKKANSQYLKSQSACLLRFYKSGVNYSDEYPKYIYNRRDLKEQWLHLPENLLLTA